MEIEPGTKQSSTLKGLTFKGALHHPPFDSVVLCKDVEIVEVLQRPHQFFSNEVSGNICQLQGQVCFRQYWQLSCHWTVPVEYKENPPYLLNWWDAAVLLLEMLKWNIHKNCSLVRTAEHNPPLARSCTSPGHLRPVFSSWYPACCPVAPFKHSGSGSPQQ